MKPPTISCARALRDGGIDAIAALNEALRDALVDLPADSEREVKRAVGRAISAVLDETVNPAVQFFPELKLDEATWIAVAKLRLIARSGT